MHIKTWRWRPSHRHKHSWTDSEVQKWAQFGSEKSMFATLKPETVGTLQRPWRKNNLEHEIVRQKLVLQIKKEGRQEIKEKKCLHHQQTLEIRREHYITAHELLIVYCKGMCRPGWCGLTPSPVLFVWSAFLCSQRCRLPWWAVIRGVKLAVNMPEQKYGSFFLQRHSILPIFRGSWAGANDGEQYPCKDLKVNVCHNYNYKVCFTVLYSQTEGSALLLNKTVKTNVGKKP